MILHQLTLLLIHMSSCSSMCIRCSWAWSKSLSCSLIKWRQLHLIILSFKWFFSSLLHLRQAVVGHISYSGFHVHHRFALCVWSLHLLQRSIWMRPTPCHFGSAISHRSAILVDNRLRVIMISNIVKWFVIMIVYQFKILKIIDGLNTFKHVHLSFNQTDILLSKSILIVLLMLKIKFAINLMTDVFWCLCFLLWQFGFRLAHVLYLRQLLILIQ